MFTNHKGHLSLSLWLTEINSRQEWSCNLYAPIRRKIAYQEEMKKYWSQFVSKNLIQVIWLYTSKLIFTTVMEKQPKHEQMIKSHSNFPLVYQYH